MHSSASVYLSTMEMRLIDQLPLGSHTGPLETPPSFIRAQNLAAYRSASSDIPICNIWNPLCHIWAPFLHLQFPPDSSQLPDFSAFTSRGSEITPESSGYI